MLNEKILLVEDDNLIIAKVADLRLKNLGYMVCGLAVPGAVAIELVVNENPISCSWTLTSWGKLTTSRLPVSSRKGSIFPLSMSHPIQMAPP